MQRAMRTRKNVVSATNAANINKLNGRKAPNIFNTILHGINSRYLNVSNTESMLFDETTSIPPPQAFVPSTPSLKRTVSSPLSINKINENNNNDIIMIIIIIYVYYHIHYL